MSRPAGMTAAARSTLSGWVREEFEAGVLARSFTSAVVLFILESILAISFAALVFNGADVGLSVARTDLFSGR